MRRIPSTGVWLSGIRLGAICVSLLLVACASTRSAGGDDSPTPDGDPASALAPETQSPAEPPPDPSDPTRIETRVGLGYKFTDLTQGASLNELRAKYALMVGTEGTFVADIGVGKIDDHPVEGDESGLTDGRFRYFHLWEMDRTKDGYLGWGTSAEIQTQGTVPGTDGSNLLAFGGLWAFQVTEHLSIYPNLIGSGVWSHNLDEFLGIVGRGDLFVTWKPPGVWNGAYLKVKPSYSYGLSGDLSGEGNGNIETALGGAFDREKRWWWDVQGRWLFEDEIEEETEGVAARWSAFVSFTYFF